MAHYSGGRNAPAYVPDSYYPPPGTYQPPVYYQPQYAPPPPRRRHFFFVNIVRPWAIVVSIIILVMNIWWFSTGRICGYSASVTDKCYWVLWNSLPLAIASMVWNLATTLSHRRVASFRPGIPLKIQLPLQFIVAAGAAASLGLLSWSFTLPSREVWSWNVASHGGMIALVAIVTLANWLLFGIIAYEWRVPSGVQTQEESYAL